MDALSPTAPKDAIVANPKYTGTLVSLHRKLLIRTLNSNKGLWVQVILFPLYALGCAAGLGGAMIFGDAWLEYMILATTLGVFALPFFQATVPSPENTVDLAQLQSLPLRPKDLMPGALLVQLLQSRNMAAVACSIITAACGSVALARHDYAGWIPLYLLGIVVSFLAAIVLAGALYFGGADDKGTGADKKRSLRSMLGVVVFLVLYGGIFYGAKALNVELMAAIASWTPFGAPVAGPLNLMRGSVVAGVLQMLIAVATVVVGWLLWVRRVGLELSQGRQVEAGAQSQGSEKGSIFLGNLRPSVWNAIFSLSLRNFKRDPRIAYALASVPVMCLFFVIVGANQPGQGMMWMALLFSTVFASQYSANVLGLDGPANWLHITANVPPRTLLTARLAPYALFSLLLSGVLLVVIGFVAGFNAVWLTVGVLSLLAGLGSLGLSAVLAAYNPFPTARPGTNPMKDRSGTSSGAIVTSLAAMFGVLVPLTPAGVWAVVIAATDGFVPLLVVPLLINAVLAALLFWLGLRLGSRRLEERYVEIFQKVKNYA